MSLRAQGMTYDQIIAHPDVIGYVRCHPDVSKCLWLGAQGYSYLPGTPGRKAYLCDNDAMRIVTRVQEAERYHAPLTIPEFLEMARDMKCNRITEGIAYLSDVGCFQLAGELRAVLGNLEYPSRTWANFFAESAGSYLNMRA
jgi:hypothetical protein